MYSHTNAHCFYLIFGLPLLWHTKMKAAKVLLYNKHHRKKNVSIVHLLKSIQQKEQQFSSF